MKIEYTRNLQSAYMKIALEESLSRTEEEMLSHNRIEGVLPLQWQQEDGVYMLRYEITGKQALDVLLAQKQADEKFVQSLLTGICGVVKELEKYLLAQEGLLLRPETVFWDTKTAGVYFCYYPGAGASLQEQFQNLMEYLLTKTDHKNVRAVELVYGVYEALLKPEFHLNEIPEILKNLYEPEESAREEEIQIQSDTEDFETGQKPTIKEKVFCWGKGRGLDIVAWIKEQIKRAIARRPAMEPLVFEPEEEEVKRGQPTVLLAEKGEEPEGIFRYEGTHYLPDIIITKLPFVIGSDDICDGKIFLPTISRQHAKVTKLDGIYFLEDLNSANGTKVAGGLLTYKTKVSLKRNEHVSFANEPYRFL